MLETRESVITNPFPPMFELVTTGKKYWSSYGMPLWHTTTDVFNPALGRESRFRLIFVQSGSVIVQLNNWRGGVVAPALICLDEHDWIVRAQGMDMQARAIFFHPAVVDSRFNFENVRNGNGLDMTSSQDIFWLRPFLQKEESHQSVISLGPTSSRRLTALFDLVCGQIQDQPDDSWPCRGRSYFLELLFYVERLFSAPEKPHSLIGGGSFPDLDSVLLYLYTHYQSKLTLTELVRTFHTNRTTLTRDFHNATGLPVMAYLNHLRIQMAAVMLRDTELSVSEIIERVGFRDATHFVRTFRKQMGYTPTAYRQHYCWLTH
jgi:AraC family L-rhamnose operon regulatory protein RhaS